ncbi:otogelin isoform X2 [Ascaphus truei]|uniref:otogelin isoform X2 n=1 Tax=Ascaphus truei TaxID=8439 RepID=UPI003F5A5276
MELHFSSTVTLFTFLLSSLWVPQAFPSENTASPNSSTSEPSESNNSSGILQKADTTSQGNQEIGTSLNKVQPTFISPVERRIHKVKCEAAPCFNGGECVQKRFCDCSRYNASGSRCQIVYDTGAERDNICRTWGQYHFETFDGLYYFFPGKFTYDLLRQNEADEQSFSIQVHNDPLCSTFPYTCERSVSLYFAGDGEIMLQKHEVLHNQLRVQLPYTVGNLQLQEIAGYVIIRLQYVFTLAWDGMSSVYIKMGTDYVGKTQGLCGNNNGIVQDELLTSYGKLTEDIEEFVNSWRENSPHEASIHGDVSSPYEPPCLRQSQHAKQMARSLCDTLLQSPFQGCHESVSPFLFMAGCANDLCMSEGDNATWCRALAEYARACAHAGNPLHGWRMMFKQCDIQCDKDLVYNECVDCCPTSCHQKKPCIDSEISCVDGCYCPEGLIYENDVCVKPSECPCDFHGTPYHPGSVVQDECNNCTCTGGKWICTEVICPAECSVTGDVHIMTFDGRKYTFQASCQYILAKSLASGIFTVTLQNAPCGLNQDGSCIQSVNLILNQDPRKQVTLTHSGDVLVYDHYKINLPYTDDVFEIRKLSSVFLQVKTQIGLQLQYDREGLRLYVQVDGRWKDDTIGLCGTFNENLQDDFLSPVGVPESTPQLFGNAWKTSSACASEHFPSPLDPCDVHLQAASYATESCSILTKDLFAPCHPYLSPVSYYEQCRRDTCKCGQACLCSALAHYTHQCHRYGITIDFRSSFSDCVISCEDTMEYSTCVSTCGQTCQALSVPEICNGDCVEGCACPQGMYLNTKMERCVERKECPCYFQGVDYHPGENIITSLGKCQCKDGIMNCESNAIVHDCPAGQIYYNCSNPEADVALSRERTCENQLLNITTSAHLPCFSDCVCPKGLVKHGDECFAPDACPCSWKAKEYFPGDIVNSSCHTCVCHHGSFQCTFHPCPSMCTVYGDRHYRTFDGLAFDFVGACKVHLIKSLSPSSFSVIAENVNCYSTGIICRKLLSISVGQSLILFDDDTGNPSSTSIMDKRQSVHIWQAGFFTFVHFPFDYITILWDQRTTIHIQVGPQWQGELSGLCGNFDLKTVNEMRTPDNFDLTNSQEFGNSWAAVECVDSSDIRNPCSMNPLREPFAKKECGILLSEVFEGCHPVVDVTWFYSNCLSDTCGCNRGGDCECFCTSVSAYAHQCCQHGIAIDWRSPRVCPYDCEYFNKVLGKGPYKLISYLDRKLLLAAKLPDGGVFPMKGEAVVPGDAVSFMLTPGLYKPKAHGRTLVSFETADRPNYFLHLGSNGTLLISKWQKSEEFRNRSTFIIHKNTWIAGYNALESFTKPGYFVHISGSSIYLTKYHHSVPFRLSTLFKFADSKIALSPPSTCEWRYDACASACFRTCRDPQGESCQEIPKVEGCIPLCPLHMVLDEVTRKCVFFEDCIEPAIGIPTLLFTTVPTRLQTLSPAFNVTVSPVPSLTFTSTTESEITVSKVSKWGVTTTAKSDFVTGFVQPSAGLTNASTYSSVSPVLLHTSQEPATTRPSATKVASTPSEVLTSGPVTKAMISSTAPLEESITTPQLLSGIPEVKSDAPSVLSAETHSTTAGESTITLTMSVATKEVEQLPLTGIVTSPEPAVTTESVVTVIKETEVISAKETPFSVPTIKPSSTSVEIPLTTLITNVSTTFFSPFVTAMHTSKSITSAPSKATSILSIEGLSTSTVPMPVTTHPRKTSHTTSAEEYLGPVDESMTTSSLMHIFTEKTTKTFFPTDEISTFGSEYTISPLRKNVSHTAPSVLFPRSTTIIPYSLFSSSVKKEELTTRTLVSTIPSGPVQTSSTIEYTLYPKVNLTIAPTSLITTELVSLKMDKATPFATKVSQLPSKTEIPVDLSGKPTILPQTSASSFHTVFANVTLKSNITEAKTLSASGSTTLVNATIPLFSESGQTFLTTASKPQIFVNVSETTISTFTLYPVKTVPETATSKYFTKSTSSYPMVSETSVQAATIPSVTRTPTLTTQLPLVTFKTKIEPTKSTTPTHALSGTETTTSSFVTPTFSTAEEMLELATKPTLRVTEEQTTLKTSKATPLPSAAMLNFTGTTLYRYSEPVSTTLTSKRFTSPSTVSTTEYKSLKAISPEKTVISPYTLAATGILTEQITTKDIDMPAARGTTDFTTTMYELRNITGSLKSIPYTGRTLLPTDYSAHETIPSSAKTASLEGASQPPSLKPSTTYSTRNVTTPVLSTAILFPSIKTSISVYRPTSASSLTDIIRTTQSTSQHSYPAFTTSLAAAYSAVSFSTAVPVISYLTTEKRALLTDAAKTTYIPSLVSALNTTATPVGEPTELTLHFSAISSSSAVKDLVLEGTRKHLPSTEKVETLLTSTKYTTRLKALSSAETYKTTGQLISVSQASTPSLAVSETLATDLPTPEQSTVVEFVTEETSTPAITITKDTISGAPKLFLSTTTFGPPIETGTVTSSSLYLTPHDGYTSKKTSESVLSGLTHGITHTSKTSGKTVMEESLATFMKPTNVSTIYEATQGTTSGIADLITSQKPLHTQHILNATDIQANASYASSTQATHPGGLAVSTASVLTSSQESKLQTSTVTTPSQILVTPVSLNATTVSPVTESSYVTTELQETVTQYSGVSTTAEGITEGMTMVPSRETVTLQTCIPYTENECIKHICMDGQLIQVNKSLHCPYNATQPSCGLLGFAVRVNGDKCCPKWECACRCSFLSDLSFVTFDGRYMALFKEASYIVSLTEGETLTIQVSKCRDTSTGNLQEAALCLAVLELTHLSNQIIIDRLNRKVTVNSRYAWPMVRKYGYKIVDTGNMYLIDTPTNIKIQWFHSTGLMIIESNSTSKPTSMGLCGFCDGNSTNDLILPNGRMLSTSDDAAEFLDSWQVPYTLKYVGKERHRDLNCSVMDCSECFGMILNQTFTSCHRYVSPEAFCELWVQDTEYLQSPCKALTAYVSMCHKFNICIEWRSSDYCPFLCPDGLAYQSCLPVCDVPPTCQNNEIDLHDTESCSVLTEGCVCPQEAVLHRTYSALCIPEEKCACTDSSGVPRAIGEVWKTSRTGCCLHKCIENETIIPVEYNCSDIQEPQCQGYGEVAVFIADNRTCCPQKVCVCNKTICKSLIPECNSSEKLAIYHQDDYCCPNYTCECDPEQCEPTELIPNCREDQTLFAAHVDNTCCIQHLCACNACSNHIPTCGEGEILTVDGNVTGKCCPAYLCVCEAARCPETECDLGKSVVEVWSPESCCPYRTCECACDKIAKPQCKLGEKLQIDEEFQNTTANVCNCTKYSCVKDNVCLSQDQGILRPGQTIVEHTSNGVCHSSHCTSLVNPVTKYHEINVTSTNCAAKCEANQVYEPPKDLTTCCGQCKNVSCLYAVVNGTLLSHMMGGYVVSFLDGCCKTCKEDGKFCKRVTVRMTIRKNDCRSNTPVNIVSCDGKCPSASIYNYNINTYARFCKCCRELGLQRRVVQLHCSGNSTWVNYSIQEPTDCSCQWS